MTANKHFSNATLVCIDCVDATRAIQAIEKSLEQCSFSQVKFLTSLETDYEFAVKIPPITSKKEYSIFCVKELHKYIETPYMLIVQYDGWIVDGTKWKEEYGEYDYIGAICGWKNANGEPCDGGHKGKGGCGGFSWRSNAMMKAASELIPVEHCHSEDIAISSAFKGDTVNGNVVVGYRDELEAKGFKFASVALERTFCIDAGKYIGQFGHHRMHLVKQDFDFSQIGKLSVTTQSCTGDKDVCEPKRSEINQEEIQLNKSYEAVLSACEDDEPKWHKEIPNIFVISKKPKEDLWNINLIEKHKGINTTMFKAIYPENGLPSIPKKGWYGCMLSILSIIEFADKNKYDNVMILEEDVILHKYFNFYMNYIVEEINQKNLPWDIIVGYDRSYLSSAGGKNIEEFTFCKRIRATTGTECIIINKRFYKKVIDLCRDIIESKNCVGHETTIDQSIYFLEPYVICPKIDLATQYPRISTISNAKCVVLKSETFFENKSDKFHLSSIETNIINTCNLSCEHCSSFSPFFKPESNTYNLDKFKADIDNISRLVSLDEFRILGGEPLLVKNIDEYIAYAKKANICKKLVLITNGTLLPSLPKEKTEAILNDIDVLQISYYSSVNNKKLDEWLLSQNSKKILVKPMSKFRKVLNTNKQNYATAKYTWLQCDAKRRCNTIVDGKLYLCFMARSIQDVLAKQYNIKDDFIGDYIDVSEVKNPIHFRLLYECLYNRPMKACNYCHGMTLQEVPHKLLGIVPKIL